MTPAVYRVQPGAWRGACRDSRKIRLEFPPESHYKTGRPCGNVVTVAQSVEPRIVIPVVAGSSPVDHPIFPIGSSVEAWKGKEETE